MNVPLKTLVDHPDIADALLQDADGSFHSSVTTYLEEWTDKTAQAMNTGLPLSEFNDLTRLAAGIETAGRVINFFVKITPAPSTSHLNGNR